MATVEIAAVGKAAGATAEQSGAPPDLVTIEISTLANGLRVATERVPAALSVATGVWVGVGARDEAAPRAGMSHFLEHLLFKGTAERTALDISRAVDRVGGDMNAFTTKEYTAFYSRLPAAKMHLGMEILGDVLAAPAFRELEFENERQVILEELAMDDDSPDDVTFRLVAERLFAGHPLGRATAGDRGSVETVTVDDLRAFHAEWYRAENMVLAVAGPVDHAEVVAEAAAHFGAIGSGGVPPVRAVPDRAHHGFHARLDDTEQVHLCVGLRGLEREDPDRDALDVVNHVLGGGMSSRLFEEIRERRGLAYSVYSGLSAYDDSGSLTIYAGTQPEHAKEVALLVRDTVQELCEGGVTDDELDVARGYLSGGYVLGLEDTGARMGRIAGQLTTLGHIRPVEDQVERWQSVDHQAVSRVCERILSQPAVVVALGPEVEEMAAVFG